VTDLSVTAARVQGGALYPWTIERGRAEVERLNTNEALASESTLNQG
jgi:hypothetical protein